MKTFLVLALTAFLSLPAFAGDGDRGGQCPLGGTCAGGSCDVDGFACRNACPLAKQAGTCRSLGSESRTLSVIVRKDLAESVALNLQRI